MRMRPINPPSLILSNQLWRNQFSADHAIVGRIITLDQRPATIIGVLPADFRLPEAHQFLTGHAIPNGEPEVFMLKRFDADELRNIGGRFNYEVIGRLAAGAVPSEAVGQMNVIAARLAKLPGSGWLNHVAYWCRCRRRGRPSAPRAFCLLSAIFAVLLIACLNLSMLALARAEHRNHDLAVRAALGATRGRLIRGALIESFVLSLGGGMLGGLLAFAGLHVLLGLAPGDLPRLDEVRVDSSVLLFALGATIATSLIAGLFQRGAPRVRTRQMACAAPAVALRPGALVRAAFGTCLSPSRPASAPFSSQPPRYSPRVSSAS